MGCAPSFQWRGKSASVFSGEVVFLLIAEPGVLVPGALVPPAGPGFQVRAPRRQEGWTPRLPGLAALEALARTGTEQFTPGF